MLEADSDEVLTVKATEFAESLTHTVHVVLGPAEPAFQAVSAAKAGALRVIVRPRAPEGSSTPQLPIRIRGHVRLELTVLILCTWDRDRSFLAVDNSMFWVRMAGKTEPLFRWEFLRAPNGTVPSAHFQVHAHRDEAIYLMLCGEGNRRVDGRAAQLDARRPRVPQVSDLHIPLGGPRFRPCLEDVLQFRIEEFNIDHQPDAIQAIEEGRRTWRRYQTGAAVRDCPREAARVLELLGYKVQPPDPLPEESAKLAMY